MSLVEHLEKIDKEDLQYVERDLSFAQKVGLGFLLFGDNHANAAFILQKLVANANNPANVCDLLHQYAIVNPSSWRTYLIEALAIIDARRVLRKLGFKWEELRQHYLPHIGQLSLHIHPLLKTLYIICERMSLAEAGRLVSEIEKKYKRSEQHLRFYDTNFLEIYLLDWMMWHIITIGDNNVNNCDMQALIVYFKINELEELKTILLDTINANSDKQRSHETTQTSTTSVKPTTEAISNNSVTTKAKTVVDRAEAADTPALIANEIITNNVDTSNDDSPDIENVPTNSGLLTTEQHKKTCTLDLEDAYKIRRDSAGIILIINQRKFHEEVETQFKHLLPKKKLTSRNGTDVDKYRLRQVFTACGYRAEEHDDLDDMAVLHQIRDAAKRSLLYDSLIICILSHGIDGAVYGCNSLPVKIADIEQIITEAKTLKNKPKMLIIQACQKNDASLNNHKSNSKVSNGAENYVDMLKAMSTVPGYESMRHTTDGTWFIQAICGAVEKYGDRKHMMDVMTMVQSNVTKQRGNQNEAMVPVTITTLRKFFYLPQCIPRSC